MTQAARRGVLATIVLFVTIAAPAQATVRKGQAADRAGDTATNNGGHDIVETAARADDAGNAAFAVRLAATPAAGSYVLGLLGTQGANGCGAPFAIFTASVSDRVAIYVRDDATSGSDYGQASVSIDGGVVAFGANDPGRLALPFDCALAATAQDPAGNTEYDATDAAIPLAADAPPAPTPTPTPAATVAPAPPTTTATTPPVAVSKTAKLSVSLEGTPSTIRRNRTMTLRLQVANDGSKSSPKVKIAIARARGLTVGKVKTLPALKPAQKRTVKLKVKLTKRAKAATTLKATVRAGKLRESSSVLLRIGKAKKAPKPQPDAKKSPLVGTFWWRVVNHVDYAWDNRGLYFADGAAVYSGFPKGGLPATCTTAPAEPNDEFDTREGCLPYTFDEKSGAVTIGDKTGTFKDGKLTIDGETYTPTQIPAAGARFAFKEHQHYSFSGMCGLFLGCTVTKQFLTMAADGQFILSRSTTTTMGDPGVGPFTAAGSYPPDQHGTYEVLANGAIKLAFADGSVRVETFVVDTNKDTGAPDPMGEGVFIGEENFYPDPSPGS